MNLLTIAVRIGSSVIALASASVAQAQVAPTSPSSDTPQTQPSAAADTPNVPVTGAPGDIVVTAQKFGSTVQSTPISIAALTGGELQSRGVSSIAALTGEVSGLSSKSGGPGQTQYAIRGLSSPGGIAPTVGFYFDEYSITPPAASTAGKIAIDPNLYDLARVEVLRGPQGTLYGASSLGGTIRLIPTSPNLSATQASVQAIAADTRGGSMSGTINAMLNLPIVTDKIALRVVGTRDHQGGFIDRVVLADFPLPDTTSTGGALSPAPRGNVDAARELRRYRNVNKADITAIRGTLLIRPTETLEITPGFSYQRIVQDGPNSTDLNPFRNAHYQPFDVPERYTDRYYLATLKIGWDVGAVNILSASAYSNRRTSNREDVSELTYKGFGDILGLGGYSVQNGGLGAGSFTESAPTKQFTQELRVSSRASTPFSWLIGGYYSYYDSDYVGQTDLPGATAAFGDTLYGAVISGKVEQYAVFANASYDVTSKLRATVGGRYFRTTNDTDSTSNGLFGTGPIPTVSAKFDGFNPMVNLSYKPSDRHMLYATASKGFRDGSTVPPIPNTCATDLAAFGFNGNPTSFNPDTVWNYEVGSKNRFFGNRLTLNAAAYHLRWSDVQQLILLPTCGFGFTANVADASVDGGELELDARLAPGLNVQGSLGYSRARFTNDTPAGTRKGDRLLNVPDWTASGSISYETPVGAAYTMFTRGDVAYVGPVDAQFDTRKRISGYTLVNGRIGLRRGPASIALFVNNLTDRRAILDYRLSQVNSLRGLDRVSIAQPRTIGVDTAISF